MNPWFDDQRTKKAEVDAYEAEQAERRGDPAAARIAYHAGGEGFCSVALGVPADYPNTRSKLAIAAVVTFARAGDFGRAVEVAQRMLAQSGALSEYGRAELARLEHEYAALLRHTTTRGSGPDRGQTVRQEVRNAFRRVA